jgi:hypothetical protein
MNNSKRIKSLTPRELRLEHIIKEIYWMARRYADGRTSYAPHMYNDAMWSAVVLGLDLKTDPITSPPTIWAADGTYGINARYREKHA